MRARLLAVTLGPQLVALVASAADALASRSGITTGVPVGAGPSGLVIIVVFVVHGIGVLIVVV